MIDPRDEALFERYHSIFLSRTAPDASAYDFVVARHAAERAVENHRTLFPLPAIEPMAEPWRSVIEALHGTDGKPEEIAGVLSKYAAAAVYRDIERLMVACALEERDDGTLATAERYRAMQLDDKLAAIAAALGGSHV